MGQASRRRPDHREVHTDLPADDLRLTPSTSEPPAGALPAGPKLADVPSARFAFLFDVPPRLLHLGRHKQEGQPPPICLLPEPYQDHWVDLQLNVPPAKLANLGNEPTISAILAVALDAWSLEVFRDPANPADGVLPAPHTEEAFLSLPSDLCWWLWQEYVQARDVPLAKSTPTVPPAPSLATSLTPNGQTHP